MTTRVGGPRVAVADLAQPALARGEATEAVAPSAELRLLGGLASALRPATSREPAPPLEPAALPLDADEAARLLAASADVARELDALSRQPLDRALAERVRRAKKMTELVARLLGMRDEVDARRRAEARG